jgi:predicted metal-dependent hydrolase
MAFDFDDATPRHWFDGDPVVTHFLNALSCSFPDGEQFFIDSVRFFQDRVEDGARRRDIAGFAGQEKMHALEHTTFNRFLARHGYGPILDEAQATARALLRGARIRFTSHEQLAATAALEHITAILANGLLADERVIGAIHPNVRPLWMWHAIEEIEHKAIAYDVYQDVDGRPGQRKALLVLGTLFLAAFTFVYTGKLLARDGALREPWVIARGLWRLFGPEGVITRTIPDYLDFFADDFHPWQHANAELVEKYRAALAARG